MSERVTPADIDRLAIASWRLGKRAMKDVLRIAPANSFVKGEIELTRQVILEPEFLIAQVYPDSLEVLPREMTLTVSERDKHINDPSFDVYSQLSLSIVGLGRVASATLNRGSIILDAANQSIRPVDGPLAGRRHRPGTAAFREVSAELERFGLDELEYFTNIVDDAMKVTLANEDD